MAEKYMLLLLLSPTGFSSKILEKKVLENPQLLENFAFLRLKNPTHILFDQIMGPGNKITDHDLPMIIMGDQVVLKGDEEVMRLMNEQATLEGFPIEDLRANLSQELTTKIIDAMRSFETESRMIDQEFYDRTTNIFEKLIILLLGALFLNLPNFKEFLLINDLKFPDFPIEMEFEDSFAPEGCIDLEFDETFTSPFFQFCMSPPTISPNQWLELFSDLNEIGVPIKPLVKSLGYYLGRHASQDLVIPSQIMNVFPPSWGQILEINIKEDRCFGGIQLKPPITNPFGWDMMLLSFFIKGAVENVIEPKKFENLEVFFKGSSRYFEFKGKVTD